MTSEGRKTIERDPGGSPDVAFGKFRGDVLLNDGGTEISVVSAQF